MHGMRDAEVSPGLQARAAMAPALTGHDEGFEIGYFAVIDVDAWWVRIMEPRWDLVARGIASWSGFATG